MNASHGENVTGTGRNKKSGVSAKRVIGFILHLLAVILLSNYLFTVYDNHRGDLLFVMVILCYFFFTFSIFYHLKSIVKL